MRKNMLFMAYWELNPQKDIREVGKVAAELRKSGKWPVDGVRIVSWYMTPSTPFWGTIVYEAENEESVFKNLLAWLNAMPGIFTTYKIAPVLPVEKAIPLALL
jgi:hypothetical protein